MVRAFQINGATLVKVKGGGALASPSLPNEARLRELGLAADKIEIVPKWRHEEIHVDDFGPNIPVELQWMLAEVMIRMRLIHFDDTILTACITESMGGGTEGVMAPAGRPMGAGKAMFQPGNHYMSLNLLSPVLNKPWRFKSCLLVTEPLSTPLGTEAIAVDCMWRAIPYALAGAGYNLAAGAGVPGELVSSGTVLWDHTLDDDNG